MHDLATNSWLAKLLYCTYAHFLITSHPAGSVNQINFVWPSCHPLFACTHSSWSNLAMLVAVYSKRIMSFKRKSIFVSVEDRCLEISAMVFNFSGLTT